MSEEKYKSLACMWSIVFMLLQVYNIYSVTTGGANVSMQIAIIFNCLVSLGFTIAYLFLTLAKKIPGPVFGIVIGAMSLYPIIDFPNNWTWFGIIPLVLGVCFIASNVSMILYLEKWESETRKAKAKKAKIEVKTESKKAKVNA